MTLLERQNILLISPEPWGKNFVSKHHYALELAKKGNKVFFLNPPKKGIPKFNPFLNNKEVSDNLFLIDYQPIFRGLRHLPTFLDVLILKIQIQILERACNTNFNIVWNFENSRFYNFKPWRKEVLKILHIVDLNQDFQTKAAATTADVCFCTSDFIKAKLKVYNKRVFKIHHGFTPGFDKGRTPLFEGVNNTKALYVGNLHIPYLDWEILSKIVENNSNVDFYFIGPIAKSNIGSSISLKAKEWVSKFKEYRNIYFLGEKAAPEIHSYLVEADILLLVYKSDIYKEQLANPHKLMEYFGSGKVVVASYTDEYKGKDNLLLMANENKQLPALFKKAIDNLSFYNSAELQQKRKVFAQENTYEKQIEKIEQILFKEGLMQ